MTDYELTRRWAAFYTARGYNALPSRQKWPPLKYASYWETPLPANTWSKYRTDSIQVMTGSRWNLAVVDLDGPEAAKTWHEWISESGCPETWMVRSGSGSGMHLWFQTPPEAKGRRKCRIWGQWDEQACGGKGGWMRRRAIELFLDRGLITAPPSVHVSGRTYRFIVGPNDIPEPAMLPAWVLEKPVLGPTSSTEQMRTQFWPEWREQQDRILGRIGDKRILAESWGLRFATRPCPSDGWVSCHDYNREDRNPSARFHLGSGRFWRPGEKTQSFFDLAADLGVYRDWREAREALAEQFGTA